MPNIRHWSRLDPEKYQLSRLVKEFLEYQRSLGNWLLTGNDDYELVKGEGGAEVRLDYNAAIFFSPSGRRVETYHKMHLVPFTEYFPWEKSLPGLYRLLLSFDVYLWEPGARRVVFQGRGEPQAPSQGRRFRVDQLCGFRRQAAGRSSLL